MALDIDLVQSTFSKVALDKERLANTFYDTLFERYPAVKPLFAHTDMASQKKKLIAALALVVTNLRTPDAFSDQVIALGRKHVGYGAQLAHYDAVGECLLFALQSVLGPDWNDDVKSAWGEAYTAVADLMKQGMQ